MHGNPGRRLSTETNYRRVVEITGAILVFKVCQLGLGEIQKFVLQSILEYRSDGLGLPIRIRRNSKVCFTVYFRIQIRWIRIAN